LKTKSEPSTNLPEHQFRFSSVKNNEKLCYKSTAFLLYSKEAVKAITEKNIIFAIEQNNIKHATSTVTTKTPTKIIACANTGD
jgi:hypothetical protein